MKIDGKTVILILLLASDLHNMCYGDEGESQEFHVEDILKYMANHPKFKQKILNPSTNTAPPETTVPPLEPETQESVSTPTETSQRVENLNDKLDKLLNLTSTYNELLVDIFKSLIEDGESVDAKTSESDSTPTVSTQTTHKRPLNPTSTAHAPAGSRPAYSEEGTRKLNADRMEKTTTNSYLMYAIVVLCLILLVVVLCSQKLKLKKCYRRLSQAEENTLYHPDYRMVASAVDSSDDDVNTEYVATKKSRGTR